MTHAATVTSAKASQTMHQALTVRKLDHQISDSVPRFWFDNNPVLTSLLASLSVGFPAGERFFIDSVRHFQAAIADQELQQQIQGFIGQEAQHTKAHIAFNQFLDRSGYPATLYANTAKKVLTGLQKISSPAQNLARTVALEHFTAIMSSSMLAHPELLEKLDPEIAQLWVWHFIEEVEHKAVAFDVYQQAVGNEALRLLEMTMVTAGFILMITGRTLVMHLGAGAPVRPKAVLSTLNVLWGNPGIFRKVIPHYFAYYRKDFHPLQHDTSAQLQSAKKRWLAESVS